MTWIYRGSNAAVSDVIYSTSVTNSACTRTIHFTLGADRKLSGGHVISNNANGGCTQTCDGGACEISSEDALSTGSWHHVSMVSKRKINKGEILTQDCVIYKNPGTGIPKKCENIVLGKKAIENIEEDVLITQQMFN